MTAPTTLLTLPLEIRHQIYSYMLLNGDIIDMIAANVTRPQESGLFLACRQLHLEAFEYYYNANTFQLSLCDPTYSPNEYLNGDPTLMKRLGSMRNLHVEIGPMKRKLVGHTSEDVYVMRPEREQRWSRFMKQLSDSNEGQVGWLLRSLVIVDRYTPRYLPQSSYSRQKPVRPPTHPSVFEKRFMALTRLVQPLADKVGKLTIEIRSRYVWTPLVPIGNYPYEVVTSSAVPPC